MDFDKLKNTDPKQVVAAIILIMMLPLLYFWYKARKGEGLNSSSPEITVNASGSQYESKLAAFKAKQRMEREQSGQRMISSDQMQAFTDVTEETQVSVSVPEPEPIQEKPVTRKVSKPQSESVPVKRENSAAQGLRNTVKNEDPKEDGQPVQKDQERRRQEMMAGWNRNQNRSSISATKTYKGVIHGTQELAGGQIAQLRVREEIRLGNVTIPSNTLISGKVRIASGRVMIDVSSVKLQNDIIPLTMTVYGSDGQPGLPTAMDVRDNVINKEITNEAISQVRRTGVIGSIASSVAGAVTREKNQKVTLIDSQSIYFKVNSR